jgi:hypothetical protein
MINDWSMLGSKVIDVLLSFNFAAILYFKYNFSSFATVD